MSFASNHIRIFSKNALQHLQTRGGQLALSTVVHPSYPKSSLLSDVKVTNRILNVASSIKGAPEKISATSHLIFDLDFDSMLRKKFVDLVSDEFCVAIDANTANSILTIDDAIYYISTHPKAR